MANCKKCNQNIPSSMMIGSKRRILNKRRYCLDCSPFGQHNTKQLHVINQTEDKLCICSVCNKEYIANKQKGNSHVRCNTCYVNQKRRTLKERAVKFMGGKCKVCGYSKCNKALQFHHLNPQDKEFNISCTGVIAWEKLQKELKKCIMLCANCHAEIHDK